MSFRELRNFTEIMRALGYQRLLSMENFRTPNFELVADILNWLVQRYDPSIQIPLEIASEQERYNKARIKLNIKKLYSADGYAVKELLKISSLLYNSMKTPEEGATDIPQPASTLTATKVSELKSSRALASSLTTLGASIYQTLQAEEARQRAVARGVDTEAVEKSIQNIIATLTHQMNDLTQKLENLESDESNLEAKIDKKKGDLQRLNNRLESFKAVRPAFMDEYEKLEVELQELHAVYIERFRNLEFLESQLEQVSEGSDHKPKEANGPAGASTSGAIASGAKSAKPNGSVVGSLSVPEESESDSESPSDSGEDLGLDSQTTAIPNDLEEEEEEEDSPSDNDF